MNQAFATQIARDADAIVVVTGERDAGTLTPVLEALRECGVFEAVLNKEKVLCVLRNFELTRGGNYDHFFYEGSAKKPDPLGQKNWDTASKYAIATQLVHQIEGHAPSVREKTIERLA